MLPERFGDLYVGGKKDPFARIKATKEMVPLDNKIIECRFEMNNGKGKWVFMRQRTDRSFPNSFNTATGKSSATFFISAILIEHVN
jgi:mRNA-capping enzyme